jgi:hypothetical protein
MLVMQLTVRSPHRRRYLGHSEDGGRGTTTSCARTLLVRSCTFCVVPRYVSFSGLVSIVISVPSNVASMSQA